MWKEKKNCIADTLSRCQEIDWPSEAQAYICNAQQELVYSEK